MAFNEEEMLLALQNGTPSIKGEFLWGSNYTFLVDVEHEEQTIQAVYKPTRGERPLWDFPAATLARREVAAYIVSQALGWHLVPPTVYVRKGPIGPGSLQLFIEHDPEYHYFNFNPNDRQRLHSVALFDVVINNADRKGSHILIDEDDRLWLIDHGICFHIEDKLRTVVWDFAGEELPQDLCVSLTEFSTRFKNSENSSGGLAGQLKKFLNPEEISAIGKRAEKLLQTGKFPNPHTSRRFQPWPPL